MIGGNAKVIKDCLPFVITDGVPARARGLNVVGLRRAGVGASQMRALKEAYRLLLRSDLMLAEALVQMERIADPLVQELIVFARIAKRGFHRGSRDGDVA
jgi:UDP-N-acetylglucosamine acyltransferase